MAVSDRWLPSNAARYHRLPQLLRRMKNGGHRGALCHTPPLPKKNMLKRDSNESRTSGRKSGGEGVQQQHNVSPLSITPPPPPKV